MTDLFIIVIILIIFVFFLINHFKIYKTSKDEYRIEEDIYTIEYITEVVRIYFNDILRTNFYNMNLSKNEFEKQIKKREQLRKSLKTCIHGDLNAKKYIKEFIKDIIQKEYSFDENSIDKIINFRNPRDLNIQDKFEILLYMYKKDYDYRALEKIIINNKLDELKDNSMYYIDKEDIEKIYNNEIKVVRRFSDKLDILVQRIYQNYKGYSVVDELRDMKIDGISGGVSGIPSNFFRNYAEGESVSEISRMPSSYDSIWIFFKGKSIQLKFLTFNSEKELIRICKNIYKYDNPGQLTETAGYKINKMKDGSRVVVVRPPFAESWAFFVRKFDSLEKIEIDELIVDKNKSLCINFLKWIVKGCQVTAITGSQGTGKTTLLMSLVSFINPIYNLRIQEVAFELHLRKIYPNRNILTFKETEDISGQKGLDLQKKTDGTVNILGEVATAPVASWMIQMAQVASLFTIFTHHAKSSYNLVKSLRNNLLQTGIFSNENIAEEQVAEVIRFDVHLSKNVDGHRYIERITEIIVKNESEYPVKYQTADNDAKIGEFLETMTEYFRRQTNKQNFITTDIIKWVDGKYEVMGKISQETYSNILFNIEKQNKDEFIEFILKNELIIDG
ncbi:ATPase, T2SS/T4P/T4SS family [Clostridiaceae bacterium HSG29]|nr:ATPase, T2SS/T4P/T4SS family [Clostridiaceae bacterium HSG29]